MDARTTRLAGLAAAGLAAAALPGVAAEPAARLRLAGGPVVARGLAPDAPAVKPDGKPDGWMTGPTSTVVKPLPAPPALVAPAPARPPSLLGGFRDLIGLAKPADTAPPAAAKKPDPQPAAAPPPAAPVPPPTVYAGPPAYRWYGWGTTTPGQNPVAPDGRPPRGSGSWLTQTGATPGAFPAAPARPADAAGLAPPDDAPLYTTRPTPDPFDGTPPVPPPGFAPVSSPVVVTGPPPLPPGAVPVGESPPPMPAAPLFAPPPPGRPPARGKTTSTVGVPPGPPPGVVAADPAAQPPVAWVAPPTSDPVAFAPRRSTDPTPTPQLVPAGATAPARPPAGAGWRPVTRGQAADDFTPPLDRAVRDAAYGFATVTGVTFTAPGRVVVKLRAKTAADAEAAAKGVAKLPQLKPLAVDFEVALPAAR